MHIHIYTSLASPSLLSSTNSHYFRILLSKKKMQRTGSSRRVSFSHGIDDKYPTVSIRSTLEARPRRHKHVHARRNVASSPVRLFHYVRTSVAKAIRMVVSTKRCQPSASKGSAYDVVVPQHQHFVPHRDSHHSEAFDDCIEFINSSYRKSI